MQVSVESNTGLERKMTVAVPADVIDNEVNKKLQNLARTQKMAGFRPGKIPMSVIKQRYGAPVRQEVLQEVTQKSFYDAVTQENIQPAGHPMIELVEDNKEGEYSFIATFEVFPEIIIKDFKDLEIEKPTAEITDADLDNMMVTLQKQRGTLEPVKRMARKEDTLNIDFKGSIDGELFEGGAAEDFSLVLGSDSMIPGFEKQLLKVKTGEERTVEVTFPKDYQSEELAGKDAVFEVTVKEVKALKLPEIDDEFVKLFGIEDGGIDKLKEEIGNNMKRELENNLKGRTKANVLESLAAANELDLPKALVDQEIEMLKQQALKQFNQGRQGSAADVPEMPAALFEEQAKKRVKLALLVNKIIEDNEIVVDPARVRSTIEATASAYDEPEQMVSWYYSNPEHLKQVESSVVEEQVIDFILEQSKQASEKSYSFDDIMNKQG